MRCFRYSNRNLNQQHSDNTAERATTPFLKGTPLMYRRNGKACVCQKNQGRINNGDEHGGMDIDVQDEIQVMADIAVCACLSQCGLLERMSQGQIHLWHLVHQNWQLASQAEYYLLNKTVWLPKTFLPCNGAQAGEGLVEDAACA